MDHRASGLYRRPRGVYRIEARSHPSGLARGISRPPKLIFRKSKYETRNPQEYLADTCEAFPLAKRSFIVCLFVPTISLILDKLHTLQKRGAMVQRLARGPFKAEIRVRFPLALPKPQKTNKNA